MKAELFPVPSTSAGQLFVMPRPRGGEWLSDEINSWRNQGVGVIICLLEEAEIGDLDLADEPTLCREHEVEFISFPIPDRGVPESMTATTEIVARIRSLLSRGTGVGIHCRMGLGRSTLLAACVLADVNRSVDDIWDNLARARGLAVPDTDEQREWVAAWRRRTGDK